MQFGASIRTNFGVGTPLSDQEAVRLSDYVQEKIPVKQKFLEQSQKKYQLKQNDPESRSWGANHALMMFIREFNRCEEVEEAVHKNVRSWTP